MKIDQQIDYSRPGSGYIDYTERRRAYASPFQAMVAVNHLTTDLTAAEAAVSAMRQENVSRIPGLFSAFSPGERSDALREMRSAERAAAEVAADLATAQVEADAGYRAFGALVLATVDKGPR